MSYDFAGTAAKAATEFGNARTQVAAVDTPTIDSGLKGLTDFATAVSDAVCLLDARERLAGRVVNTDQISALRELARQLIGAAPAAKSLILQIQATLAKISP